MYMKLVTDKTISATFGPCLDQIGRRLYQDSFIQLAKADAPCFMRWTRLHLNTRENK